MIFYLNRRNVDTIPSLKFGDKQIEVVKEYKYLGLIVDNNLNFSPHMNALIQNINYKTFQFYKLRKFISERSATHIYKTLILPILNYAFYSIFSSVQDH